MNDENNADGKKGIERKRVNFFPMLHKIRSSLTNTTTAATTPTPMPAAAPSEREEEEAAVSPMVPGRSYEPS